MENQVPNPSEPREAVPNTQPTSQQTAQDKNNTSYGQSPQGQNPYAQNPYVQNNPYIQNPQGQNPYAKNNPYRQNNTYAHNPYANGPVQNGYRPVYTQNASAPKGYYYPNGNYAPYGQGYSAPNPVNPKAEKEKKEIKACSTAHGLAVLGFSIFSVLFSFFLVHAIPNFPHLYERNDLFRTAIDLLFSVVVIFLPFFICYTVLQKKKILKELPFGKPYQASSAVLLIFAGLAACLAGSYLSGVFNTILETLFDVHFTMPPDDVPLKSLPIILLSVLKIAIIPAFVEEFAVRGVVMQSLKKYGDWFAILMSALVFALMHGNMVQIPFAFIAGIAIGYATMVTGSLWTGILIHFGNNFLSLMLQVMGDNMTDAMQSLVGGIMLSLVFALGLVCAILYFVRFRKVPLSKGETVMATGTCAKHYICTVAMILSILYLVFQTMQYIKF